MKDMNDLTVPEIIALADAQIEGPYSVESDARTALSLVAALARRLRNHYAAHIISEAEAGPLNPKPGDAE